MRKRAKYWGKPGQMTRKESEGAKLYAEALKELPPLIQSLKERRLVKVAPPLTEHQADRIRKNLNKYGRANKAATGSGQVSMV